MNFKTTCTAMLAGMALAFGACAQVDTTPTPAAAGGPSVTTPGTTPVVTAPKDGATPAVKTDADPYKSFVLDGPAEYSFGKIDPDQSVEHTFIFKNNSKELITIENARASCGCTAAVITEKDVKPGGEGKIQVKFTPPKGTRGEVHKSVSVYLKGETEPHTVLRFSAEVLSDLDIQPSYIQMINSVAGEPVSGKAVVKNISPVEFEVTQEAPNLTLYVDTSTAAATGSTNPVAEPLKNVKVEPKSFKLKPGESREVVVTIVPQKRGQINGWVRLKTPKGEAMITVYGIVRAKTK